MKWPENYEERKIMQKEKDIKELDWDVIMTAYQEGEPFEDIAAANGLTVRSLADRMRKVAGVVDPDVPLNEREKKRMLHRLRRNAATSHSIRDRWSEMQDLFRKAGVLN